MTEIVLLYILTAMTAAGLILSILLLQKYGAAQTEIAALKAEQQRLAVAADRGNAPQCAGNGAGAAKHAD